MLFLKKINNDSIDSVIQWFGKLIYHKYIVILKWSANDVINNIIYKLLFKLSI